MLVGETIAETSFHNADNIWESPAGHDLCFPCVANYHVGGLLTIVSPEKGTKEGEKSNFNNSRNVFLFMKFSTCSIIIAISSLLSSF